MRVATDGGAPSTQTTNAKKGTPMTTQTTTPKAPENIDEMVQAAHAEILDPNSDTNRDKPSGSYYDCIPGAVHVKPESQGGDHRFAMISPNDGAGMKKIEEEDDDLCLRDDIPSAGFVEFAVSSPFGPIGACLTPEEAEQVAAQLIASAIIAREFETAAE